MNEATTMAQKQQKYDMEYKIQAIGGAKATAELGIPENTMYARKKKSAAWKKKTNFGKR